MDHEGLEAGSAQAGGVDLEEVAGWPEDNGGVTGGGLERLAESGDEDPQGAFRRGTTALHVSPGLGTTFVPFRFFARPEATELVLRSGHDHGGT